MIHKCALKLFQKWQLGTVFLPDSFGYLIGTNCFALIALRFGRHYMAIIAMLSVGISAITVRTPYIMYLRKVPVTNLKQPLRS